MRINIGSKADLKGFKQAESAVNRLENGAKSLAKTLGVAFSARAVVQFGQASVKAFVADDNAARSLGVTLKNLGLETGNTSIYINDMISRLEKQTGVLDDQLRPAMDRLLRATGSITKSQTLLNLALDISAGTGKDLTTVSQGLQKAYLGNNASLGRLGVGLSKAELTSSSFEEIQVRLTKLFAGQASSAAASYAGQLNILAIASNNVKEIIGKGLVDALISIGENQSVSNLATQMETVATNTADVIRGVGLIVASLKKLPGTGFFDSFFKFADKYNLISIVGKSGAQSRRAAEVAKGKNPIQSGSYLNKAKPTPVDTAAAKAAAASLAAQKKALKLTQDAQKLSRAGSIFDLKQIEITAALKGNLTEEERVRLQLLLAVEQGNVDKADELTKKLKIIQDQNTALAAAIAALPTAGNPFADADNGQKVLAQDIIDTRDGLKDLADDIVAYHQALGDMTAKQLADAQDVRDAYKNLQDDIAAYKLAIESAAEAKRILNSMGGGAPGGIAPNGGGGGINAGDYAPYIPPGTSAGGGGSQFMQPSSISITVNGAVDPIGAARAITDVLNEASGNTTSDIIGAWYKSKQLAG